MKKNGSLSKFTVKKEKKRERKKNEDKGIRNVDERGIGCCNEEA